MRDSRVPHSRGGSSGPKDGNGPAFPPDPSRADRAEPVRPRASDGCRSSHLPWIKEGSKTMEATHENVSPQDDAKRCEQCGASFSTWEDLGRHQTLAHPGEGDPETERSRRARTGAPEGPSSSRPRPDESEMSDQRASPYVRTSPSPGPSGEASDDDAPEPGSPRRPAPPSRNPMTEEPPEMGDRTREPTPPGSHAGRSAAPPGTGTRRTMKDEEPSENREPRDRSRKTGGTPSN